MLLTPTLKMDAAGYSKMFLPFCLVALCYVTEYCDLHVTALKTSDLICWYACLVNGSSRSVNSVLTGCAKHIQFKPLWSEDVKLPDGALFVIAHSLAVLNKAKTSDFNCRVAECRLAAQVTC